MQEAFPKLLKHMEHMVPWRDLRKPKWLSNGCDIAALAWVVLHGSTRPDGPRAAAACAKGAAGPRCAKWEMLWVLQQDVGCTCRGSEHRACLSGRASHTVGAAPQTRPLTLWAIGSARALALCAKPVCAGGREACPRCSSLRTRAVS